MSLEDRLYPFLKLYKSLPYPVKFLMGKIYNLLPVKLKFGKFYYSYLKRITNFNEEKEQVLLSKQIKIALNKINYYKHREYKDITEFPIIKKETISNSHQDFVNPENPNRIKTNTGGSSGNPLDFYLEKGISRPKEKAHFDWYWKQFGYTPGDKILMIRGESLVGDKIVEYQALENKLAISCYLLNEHNINETISKINIFNPRFIHAYPSALKNFISLVKTASIPLKTNIQASFLGSEGLYENDRQLIASFFKTKICHWYGHSERLIHAGNCPYTDEFHIFPFYGYVELLDDDGKIIEKPSKKGRIIATGFDNSVMPFIRYDTGDEAEYSDSQVCACGFKGKSFKTIYGRNQDYIYLNDKTKVSLTAFIFGQHFEEFSLINEIQLEQNELGKIDIRITLNKDSELNKEKFIAKLKKSVQNKIEINLYVVPFILKTHRGKHVFLIQNTSF